MKRAQAALEFIMTYGWAVLVLLVMIGALAYFGVTNPTKLIPEKCLFEAGFGCTDYRATVSGTSLRIQFALENKAGDSVAFQRINASTTRGGVTYSVNCTQTPTGWIDPDAVPIFNCMLAAGSSPGVGQNAKINVQLNYTTGRGVFSRTSSGEIQTSVQ